MTCLYLYEMFDLEKRLGADRYFIEFIYTSFLAAANFSSLLLSDIIMYMIFQI